MTYCGDSKASNLTLANVPWHEEVLTANTIANPLILTLQVLHFVQQLADLLPEYEMACEHEHSNCVLIAHTKVLAHNRYTVASY